MERKRYDFVLGIGPACSCSQSLRAAGLQLTSLPFDWNGLQTIPDRQRLLETDFQDWLNLGDFESVGEDVLGRKNVWYNKRTKCTFAHDFGGEITEELIQAVGAKYRRRIDRMYRLIEHSKNVLIVWVQIDQFSMPSNEELQAFIAVFRNRWPNVTFDMLFFDWIPNVSEANAEDCSSDGIRRVAFDYRDYSQERWFANYDLLARWLKSRYTVRDYRTPEEKRAWRRSERDSKFARFGVHNWVAYFFARSAYALKKHFANRGGNKA